MKTLQIFDPAMCCSTGVCGPSVDQNLVRFAADIEFLKDQGVSVERFNLAHQPAQFTAQASVLAEMGTAAENLPVILANGVVRAKGSYPSRETMAEWFGITASARVPLRMAAPCCENGDCDCT
jgi:hypothetical protein